MHNDRGIIMRTYITLTAVQWRNEGLSPHPHAWPGNFCWHTGKRGGQGRKGKKGKWGGKEIKVERQEVENWKWKGKGMKMSRGPFIFFFFFTFHFLKPLNFLGGLPKWTIFTGKNHISCWEKNRENWLYPLLKIFLLHPWSCQ